MLTSQPFINVDVSKVIYTQVQLGFYENSKQKQTYKSVRKILYLVAEPFV